MVPRPSEKLSLRTLIFSGLRDFLVSHHADLYPVCIPSAFWDTGGIQSYYPLDLLRDDLDRNVLHLRAVDNIALSRLIAGVTSTGLDAVD